VSDIGTRLYRNELAKRNDLDEVSVIRRYVLHNSRMDRPAVLTVRIVYQRGLGKSYTVVSADNCQGITRHILERMVQSEMEASKSGGEEASLLSPDHYDFSLEGTASVEGHRCYVLGLHPKQKSKYLLQGQASVDASDFGPVKPVVRPHGNGKDRKGAREYCRSKVDQRHASEKGIGFVAMRMREAAGVNSVPNLVFEQPTRDQRVFTDSLSWRPVFRKKLRQCDRAIKVDHDPPGPRRAPSSAPRTP